MRLFFVLAAISLLHAELNSWASVHEHSAQFQNQATEIEEARKLNLEAAEFINQGAYDQAMPKAVRALEMRTRIFGPDRPELLGPITNIGHVLHKQNNYSKAREYFERASTIIEQHKLESKDAANALNNYGLLYYAEKNYDNAERLYRRALAILERLPQESESRITANIMSNLGQLLLLAKRDYKGAETLYSHLLEIQGKRVGPNDPELTGTLNYLALAYQYQGDFDKATPLYQRAITILEKSLMTADPLLAIILRNLSSLSNAQGDITRAVALAERASEIEEKNLSFSLANAAPDVINSYHTTFRNGMMMDISLHIRDAPDNRSAARLALTTVLRRKGRVLDSMIDSTRALRVRSNPVDKKLLDELSVVQSQLAAIISRNPDATSGSYDPAFITKLGEYQKLQAKVSALSAESKEQSEPVTIESIQKLIPEDAALIEFVCYNPFNAKPKTELERWDSRHYAAYILHHNGEVSWADLGDALSIDFDVSDLRAALRNPNNKPDGQDIQTVARSLYDRLDGAFSKILGTTHQLFISPDSTLQLIPFEALVDKRGHYLVEKYSFTYLSSARDLRRLKFSSLSRQAPLVIANPDYNSTGVKTAKRNSGRSQSPGLPQNSYEPLDSAEEARQIAKLLPGSRVWEGPAATESALKQVHGPSVLHVSTHGFFPKIVPWGPTNLDFTKINGEEVFKPSLSNIMLEGDRSKTEAEYIYSLSQSGLVLAGANNRDRSNGEDGILTAFEIIGLDLYGTKMVVLSACETGLADVNSGDGVDGLRRSLLLAGAESQVTSLWKVNDEVTRDFMTSFYVKLRAGMDKSLALREIKLTLLRNKNYSH